MSSPIDATSEGIAAHIFSPYDHIASLSSKNVRSQIADAFNSWLHLPPAALAGVKLIVDKLHNASLLVDDIEDSSVMRRGAPTAHRLFGMPLTLNCANHVYFIALNDVLGLVPSLAARNEGEEDEGVTSAETGWKRFYRGNEQLLTVQLASIFASELVELHEGQGMDILWRDTFACPSLAQYDSMVLKKTGGLFRLALRMMIALAPPPPMHQKVLSSVVAGSQEDDQQEKALPERNEKLVRLVNSIGLFFQTLDDLLNIVNTDYHQVKSFCDDLTEGKFSYPVIHCILQSRAQGDHRLYHIVRQRPQDTEVKAFAVKLMHDSGSVAACRARVEELQLSIASQVDGLGGCPQLIAAVNTLAKMMN